MFRHPIVKPAFNLSWFLLILGGISLFEKSGWGIVGAVMFCVGLMIFAFTMFAVYLKKQFIDEPGWLLVLSISLLLILVLAQVIFGRFILAAVIAALCSPIVFGWIKVKSTPAKSGKSKKKK